VRHADKIPDKPVKDLNYPATETFGTLRASREQAGVTQMSESRTSALAVRTEPARAWAIGALQTSSNVLGRAGVWAGETAQNFGALLSALMGPAVFSAYAFAAWSLASNLGWTDTFVFSAGPLSNWLIWLAIAILVNLASSILKRHTQLEKS
jgi:hypothetical protein